MLGGVGRVARKRASLIVLMSRFSGLVVSFGSDKFG
jgi:hypothetical protein